MKGLIGALRQAWTSSMHGFKTDRSDRESPSATAFERAWRQRFIEFAEVSDDDAGIAGWRRSGLETRVRQFLAAWDGAEPGSLWLDAGCGAGTYTLILSGAGVSVVAVDYSPLAIAKARARVPGRCLWVVADVTRLPFTAGRFDGILCLGITQALASSEQVVGELAAHASPGAVVWVDALNAACVANAWERFRRWVRRQPMHLRYESPRRLTRLLMRAGFHDLALYWIPILPQRLQRLQPLFETWIAKALLRWVPALGPLVSHSFLIRAQKPGGRTRAALS